MANPSPGNSITLRVEAPSSFSATSELAGGIYLGCVTSNFSAAA